MSTVLRTGLALSCLAVAIGCDGGSATPPAPPDATPVCGDGVLDPGEDCELLGDGTYPAGCQACAACGNGRISGYERCDDGNATPGDGCTACLRPGDNLGWMIDAPHHWLLLPRAGGGVRSVYQSTGAIEVLDATVHGEGTTTYASHGQAEHYVTSAAANAPDGGIVACGYDQTSSSHGSTSVVVSIGSSGHARWAHAIEPLFGRKRSCNDVAVDPASGQVLSVVTTWEASGDAGYPESRLFRHDPLTGGIVGETLLSGWFADGALGEKQAIIGQLIVLPDSTVIVAGSDAARLPILAALDASGARRWRIGARAIVKDLVVAGDRAIVVDHTGVSRIGAADGVVTQAWSFGRPVSWVAVNRAGTAVAALGLQDQSFVQLAGWTIDGAPRFEAEVGLDAEGKLSGLALADDGVIYTVTSGRHHRDGKLWALSP
jgi:cysteine-rich repeat protein